MTLSPLSNHVCVCVQRSFFASCRANCCHTFPTLNENTQVVCHRLTARPLCTPSPSFACSSHAHAAPPCGDSCSCPPNLLWVCTGHAPWVPQRRPRTHLSTLCDPGVNESSRFGAALSPRLHRCTRPMLGAQESGTISASMPPQACRCALVGPGMQTQHRVPFHGEVYPGRARGSTHVLVARPLGERGCNGWLCAAAVADC